MENYKYFYNDYGNNIYVAGNNLNRARQNALIDKFCRSVPDLRGHLREFYDYCKRPNFGNIAEQLEERVFMDDEFIPDEDKILVDELRRVYNSVDEDLERVPEIPMNISDDEDQIYRIPREVEFRPRGRDLDLFQFRTGRNEIPRFEERNNFQRLDRELDFSLHNDRNYIDLTGNSPDLPPKDKGEADDVLVLEEKDIKKPILSMQEPLINKREKKRIRRRSPSPQEVYLESESESRSENIERRIDREDEYEDSFINDEESDREPSSSEEEFEEASYEVVEPRADLVYEMEEKEKAIIADVKRTIKKVKKIKIKNIEEFYQHYDRYVEQDDKAVNMRKHLTRWNDEKKQEEKDRILRVYDIGDYYYFREKYCNPKNLPYEFVKTKYTCHYVGDYADIDGRPCRWKIGHRAHGGPPVDMYVVFPYCNMIHIAIARYEDLIGE